MRGTASWPAGVKWECHNFKCNNQLAFLSPKWQIRRGNIPSDIIIISCLGICKILTRLWIMKSIKIKTGNNYIKPGLGWPLRGERILKWWKCRVGRDTVGLNSDLETMSYIMCDGTSQEMISSPPTWIIIKLSDDESQLCSPLHYLPLLPNQTDHWVPGGVPEQDDEGSGWVD